MTPSDFKKRRIILGLTVREFAKAIGISYRAVQRYESGERPIPGYIAAKVRVVYDAIHNPL